MALDVEAVQGALFARLVAKVTGLAKTSRSFLHFDQIAAANLPAMIVIGQRAQARTDFSHPQKWTLTALVIFYIALPAQAEQVPETVLYSLIKQVETALQPQPGEAVFDDYPTSLGGLVRYARIADHEIHHGAGGQRAAATLTIEMLALE